jgi:hypothetical protein
MGMVARNDLVHLEETLAETDHQGNPVSLSNEPRIIESKVAAYLSD